ncbi:hypothetical protein COLO4_16083 [Corchorus olitorius]|uniref:Uncharacterized protein n=1 Tax=Corchorus olitorius TaxID=93759 RepID=A0A1R3JJR0_9ROSI|nr:hypothetical protein COLO4_16083 [Corchorus olitorius]
MPASAPPASLSHFDFQQQAGTLQVKALWEIEAFEAAQG